MAGAGLRRHGVEGMRPAIRFAYVQATTSCCGEATGSARKSRPAGDALDDEGVEDAMVWTSPRFQSAMSTGAPAGSRHGRLPSIFYEPSTFVLEVMTSVAEADFDGRDHRGDAFMMAEDADEERTPGRAMI